MYTIKLRMLRQSVQGGSTITKFGNKESWGERGWRRRGEGGEVGGLEIFISLSLTSQNIWSFIYQPHPSRVGSPTSFSSLLLSKHHSSSDGDVSDVYQGAGVITKLHLHNVQVAQTVSVIHNIAHFSYIHCMHHPRCTACIVVIHIEYTSPVAIDIW